MKEFLRLALLVALLTGLAVGNGCRPPVKQPSDRPITKVEYFRARQANTTTTHGKIKLDTVQETLDGVEYRTEDGKRWRVRMEPTEAGGFRFSEPKPLD